MESCIPKSFDGTDAGRMPRGVAYESLIGVRPPTLPLRANIENGTIHELGKPPPTLLDADRSPSRL